ncbi:MAG TPA: protein kinase [Polyangia bacterium]|nr:protein kinase [Polyangia bacterium]
MAEPGAFPRRFGSYVLLKPLARGGMGDLYLAIGGARGMEKLCVIKKVLPHLVAPDNVKRFRDEAMVVVKLSHGNLVTVFDAGRKDDEIYLAMEYVDGKDLLAVWNRCAEKRVPFPVEVVVYIVKELARGLGYAHAFGGLNLVHRDVSPANVLLSYTGEVKLTDFGLATSTLKLQHTAPGIIFGKLSYLSPEQARSEPLDGRTDIYAAGILLWELLTGQQLFPVKAAQPGPASPDRRDATADALARLRNPNVLPPSRVTSRVPPELDRIVLRALAAEKAFRYQNGEELRADLAAFLAKTAPETDADRLAKFLKPLFGDDIVSEEIERTDLVQHANNLLSTATRGPAPVTAVAGAMNIGDAVAVPVSPVDSGDVRDDPRIGTTIGGRYLLRRLCGEGAMGRVYEGHHVDIGRRVAIKILHSSFRHSDEVVERFRREARAASRIGHPNIVDVTDSGTTADGAFYFVMEYLDGVSLETLVARSGKLPPERAITIAAQICRALQAAHAADIIHRDLKPANVMLVNHREEADFVKVLDFGISKDLDLQPAGPRRAGLTRPDVAVGTPIYMSPEQAAGNTADARTDIYAVGGLLYEMLTGEAPCDGDDVIAVLSRKATEDPLPLRQRRPELTARLEGVVMRALSRAPEDRQPSMAVLKDELVACLSAMQATPPPEAVRQSMAVGHTTRTRVLRPRAWMLVAAAVLLGGGLGYFSFLRDPPSRSPATAPPPPGPTESTAPTTTVGPAARPTMAAAVLPPTEPGAAQPTARPTTTAVAPPAGLGSDWPEPSSARLAEQPSPPVVAHNPPSQARTVGPGRPRSGPPFGPSNRPSASAIAAARALPTGNEILGRAQTAFNKGDYPEAIRRGKEAIGAGAAAAGHLLLGDAYYHLERYTEAAREYQNTLTLDPGNAQARRGRDLARSASAGADATP